MTIKEGTSYKIKITFKVKVEHLTVGQDFRTAPYIYLICIELQFFVLNIENKILAGVKFGLFVAGSAVTDKFIIFNRWLWVLTVSFFLTSFYRFLLSFIHVYVLF